MFDSERLGLIQGFVDALSEKQRENLHKRAQSGKLVFQKWVQKNGALSTCLTLAAFSEEEIYTMFEDAFKNTPSDSDPNNYFPSFENARLTIAIGLNNQKLLDPTMIENIIEAWDDLRWGTQHEIVKRFAEGKFQDLTTADRSSETVDSPYRPPDA